MSSHLKKKLMQDICKLEDIENDDWFEVWDRWERYSDLFSLSDENYLVTLLSEVDDAMNLRKQFLFNILLKLKCWKSISSSDLKILLRNVDVVPYFLIVAELFKRKMNPRANQSH